MPNVRKLTPEEVRDIENKGKGQRKLIEEEYDAFISEYSAGDYGEALLDPGENRLTVRNRLKAAARRRGLGLHFRRTKEDMLRFQVIPAEPAREAAPPISVSTVPAKKGGRRKKNA
jgi:hypothetical protein